MSTARVDFTRGAAERIARVVRIVEQGDRDGSPLSFGKAEENNAARRVFRVCTFTGQWDVNAFKELTFFNVTTTPNTVTARNLYLPVEVISGKSAECSIAREHGTSWYLTSVNLTKLKGYDTAAIQVFGHSTGGYAEWFSVTTCGTATASP